MSGFDRMILGEKLEKLGWTRAPELDCGSLSGACYIPPESLWQNRPAQFYVYDARDLQNMLGESVGEE